MSQLLKISQSESQSRETQHFLLQKSQPPISQMQLLSQARLSREVLYTLANSTANNVLGVLQQYVIVTNSRAAWDSVTMTFHINVRPEVCWVPLDTVLCPMNEIIVCNLYIPS